MHAPAPSHVDVALDARDLVKTYPAGRGKPPVRALDGLSVQVAAGSVFGLLGRNGAGKSTTVKILSRGQPAGAVRQPGLGRGRGWPPWPDSPC